jgi:hypothetical protein
MPINPRLAGSGVIAELTVPEITSLSGPAGPVHDASAQDSSP